MKRKKDIIVFLEDNHCMINSLMCKEESRKFNGDVVNILLTGIKTEIKAETTNERKNQNITKRNRPVVLTRTVMIDGITHFINIEKDNSCDNFNYYLKDDKNLFCTRISDDVVEQWKPEEPKAFDSLKSFIEYFGDEVEMVLPNEGKNYIQTMDEYGQEFVNLFFNEIVVMKE